jgi:hypothetical protein
MAVTSGEKQYKDISAASASNENSTEYSLKTVTKEKDEVLDEIRRNVDKFNDPVVLAALLHRTANERENSNRILKNILGKLEALDRRIGALENERRSVQAHVPNAPKPPMDIIHPEADEKIIAYIKEHGKACAEDIRSEFGYKGKNAASSRLNRLFELGVLEKRQAGRKVYYVTPSENPK